jgi:hypothetical protein
MARKKKMDDGHIPNAELDVLACLWQEGPVTARRIRGTEVPPDGRQRRDPLHPARPGTATRSRSVGKAFLFSMANEVTNEYGGGHDRQSSTAMPVRCGRPERQKGAK